MIRRIRDYLTSPDAYEARPGAHALNQAGHSALGATVAWLDLPGGPLLWIAVYLLSIEAPQFVLWEGSAEDGAEDAGHVLVGMLAVAADWRIALVGALWIAAGTLRRARKKPLKQE